MKIPYQLVSMAAMLRDFFALNSDDYLNKEHQMLTDIADYLYNSADGAFSDHHQQEFPDRLGRLITLYLISKY